MKNDRYAKKHPVPMGAGFFRIDCVSYKKIDIIIEETR